ncbi:MAG TPA: cobalt ECF transporter T component CbiQ [Actinobacteria bacterium]|nr:cobalt ECF transporter T component CbiQ [Actinomycetota bacterium]
MKNIFSTPLKLIISIVLIFLLNSLENGNFLFLAVFSVFAVFIMLSFLPNWKIFFKRFLRIIPVPVFLSVFVPFSGKGNVIYSINWKIISLSVTDMGLITFYSVLIKSFLSIAIITALMSSSKEREIFYSLRRFRLPGIFVMTMFLMYRYIFLFREEFNTGCKAINARIFKRTYFSYNRKISYLIGSIFLKSFNRAENIYKAMAARGFDGDFYISQDEITIKKSGMLLMSFILASAIAIRIIDIFI